MFFFYAFLFFVFFYNPFEVTCILKDTAHIITNTKVVLIIYKVFDKTNIFIEKKRKKEDRIIIRFKKNFTVF